MELKKRFGTREVLICAYVSFLLVYLTVFVAVGLSPAGASEPIVSAQLSVPSIGLESGVVALQLNDRSLETPADLVGSYSRSPNKTLLIGHSSTVFRDLDNVNLGDSILYNNTYYLVSKISVMARDEINMRRLLSRAEKDTLVLMTCTGDDLGGGDATHRLIMTAEAQ